MWSGRRCKISFEILRYNFGMSGQYDSAEAVEAFERYKVEDPTIVFVERPTLKVLCGPLNGLRVLDAGCGYGDYSGWVAEAGATVVGADASEQMIVTARKRCPDILFLHCPHEHLASHPKLKGEQFDLALCMFTLQYAASEAGLADQLRNIRNLLKDGGRLIGAYSVPQPPEIAAKYGFESEYDKALHPPGSLFPFTSKLSDGKVFHALELHIDREFFERAARTAGFASTAFHAPIVDKEGVKLKGEEWWRDFIQIPLVQFFICTA